MMGTILAGNPDEAGGLPVRIFSAALDLLDAFNIWPEYACGKLHDPVFKINPLYGGVV